MKVRWTHGIDAPGLLVAVLLLLFVECISSVAGQPVSPWIVGDSVSEVHGKGRQFTGIIIRTSVNVRSGPGFNCDVIDQLRIGTEVRIYGKIGPWYEIDLDDEVSGWLSSKFVRKSIRRLPPTLGITRELSSFGLTVEVTPVPRTLPGNIIGNRVNVREQPSKDGGFVTKISRGQKVEIIEEAGEWTRIKLVGDRRGWIFDELVQEKAKILGTVTGNGVNVRSEGGIYFEALTKVYKGMELPIITKQGEWYQIVLPDGKVGWIIERFFKPPPPRPVISPSPAGATVETGAPVSPGDTDSDDEELLLELQFR